MAWSKLRPVQWVAIILAALVVAASLAPIAYDIWYFDDLMVRGRAMVGRDFVNSWAGGHLAVQGRAAEIYSTEYIPMVRELLARPLGAHNFSYPPTLLLFVWPLAFLAYVPALLLWTTATGAAFLLAARSYLDRAALPLWVAALLPACLVNLWAGHHGFVLAALWLAAFASLPSRPLLAGLLFALLTLKPHMGALIPLVLLIRGEWRTIAAASAGTAAMVAASVLVFGLEAWVNYFDWTAELQASFLVRQQAFYFYLMPTAYVSVWVATKSAWLAILAQGLFAAAALGVTVKAARSDMPWPELGLVTATATFLVLPYAFNYDMIVVGLGAAILLFRRSERPQWIGRGLALLAFAIPILVFAANYFLVPLLPLALLGFLLVQLRCYLPRSERRGAPVIPVAAAAAA